MVCVAVSRPSPGSPVSPLRVAAVAPENADETALYEGLTLTDPGGLPVVWVDPSGQGTWGRFIALFGALERARTDLELRVARARCATTSASGTGSRTTTSPRPNAFRSVHARHWSGGSRSRAKLKHLAGLRTNKRQGK